MADLIIFIIDSALHDLEFLSNDRNRPRAYFNNLELLGFRLRNLKRFAQICGKERCFTSLLIGIEETVRRCVEQMHLGCAITDLCLTQKFQGDTLFIVTKIDEWYYSCESRTNLTLDAVNDIIGFISEALGDVRLLPSYEESYEIIEALEEQMSFMKRLISYVATWISGEFIHDLLFHAAFFTIKTVCLLLTFHYHGDFQHKIPIYLQKDLEPLYEIYTRALSSLGMHGRLGWDDNEAFIAMKDFVDSLISNLWDLLRTLDTWTISTQYIQELYGGLKSLKTALKQPYSLIIKIKEDIGKTVCDAGVFICSLHHAQREIDPGLLKNLLDTMNGILAEIAAKKPDVPMLNALNISPEGGKNEIEVKGLPSLGASSSTNEVVGFENDEELLVDQLVRGSEQLRIIAIVGMPGLGKTTLARKAYTNPSVLFHFHIRAWCHISHVADKRRVLQDLLNQIDPSKCFKWYTEDGLAEALRRSLLKRRYLIILDDVWDKETWDNLSISFTSEWDSNNCGSRIIMTSRRHDIAPPKLLIDQKPYFLCQLNGKESLKLLQQELSFGLSVDLGMKFAEKCGGLPLMILTVAGVLKHAESKDWDKILDCLSDVSMTERSRKTLELSYMQLPVYLRPCLLYFGTFLQNQEVSVKRLLLLWIAEGFVRRDDTKNPEDYLNDLIDRSLVMVAQQRSLGGVKTCQIHDLIRDFCVQKAKDEHLFHLVRGCDELSAFNEPYNLQRLCIHSEAEHFKQSKLFGPSARSLILNSSESTQTLIEGIELRRISHAFRIFKRLRVLDLEQVHLGYRFPVEIEQFVQLTFLAILCEEGEIPSWIGNLSSLETFIKLGDINGHLPDSIWNLQKLQYLYLGGGDGYYTFSEFNLDSPISLLELDRVSGVVIPYSKMESLLRKFPNIRKLKYRLLYSWGDGNNLVVPNILSQASNIPCITFEFQLTINDVILFFFVVSFSCS